MKATQKILVTFVNQYDVDGAKGTTVNYFFLDDDGEFKSSTDKVLPRGQQCAKVSLPYEDIDKFYAIPGIYEGTFEMAVGSDRKPVLKLVDVAYRVPSVIREWLAGDDDNNKKASK